MKMPLCSVLSVYTNSETAVAGVLIFKVRRKADGR